VDLPGRPNTDFTDSRVKAVLCLSPQGPNQFGLRDTSFEYIYIPFLGVSGSLDSIGPLASPAWHSAAFRGSHAGDKYAVFLEGANYMSFITPKTPQASHETQGRELFDATNSVSLAFWDAYLKQNPTAKAFLQSDTMARASDGTVQIQRR